MAGSVPDLPGVRAPSQGARDIMLEIMTLLRRHSMNFPGAQPVSFSRRHFSELASEDYYVCEKSDGLRCLMLLSAVDDGNGKEERTYLITRKGEVSWLQGFHVPASSKDLMGFQVGTLIDGELVKLRDENKMRFYMFDLLAQGGKLLVDRDLNKRLGYLKACVADPFNELCTKFPQETSQFPFRIHMKPMSEAFRLEKVLQTPRDHLSDGLIFTSVEAPYMFGTDPKIVKWKPADENSVDFALRLDIPVKENGDLDFEVKPRARLLAWHGKYDRVYADLYLEDEEWNKLKAGKEPLQYRIAECTMDSEGRWRLLRFRDDKEHGNNVDVVNSVLDSIKDHITVADLAAEIPEIQNSWESRHRSKKRQKT